MRGSSWASNIRAPATSAEVPASAALPQSTLVDVVPSLQTPDPDHLPPLERLVQVEAVRLFVDRARDVRADFALTGENARAVVAICRRLDGLPLAL